jgi:hypothetical protein
VPARKGEKEWSEAQWKEFRKLERQRRPLSSGAFDRDLARKTTSLEGTKMVRWSILILRSKAVWLGDVEAASEAEAIVKGAEKFKQSTEQLMAVKRA